MRSKGCANRSRTAGWSSRQRSVRSSSLSVHAVAPRRDVRGPSTNGTDKKHPALSTSPRSPHVAHSTVDSVPIPCRPGSSDVEKDDAIDGPGDHTDRVVVANAHALPPVVVKESLGRADAEEQPPVSNPRDPVRVIRRGEDDLRDLVDRRIILSEVAEAEATLPMPKPPPVDPIPEGRGSCTYRHRSGAEYISIRIGDMFAASSCRGHPMNSE